MTLSVTDLARFVEMRKAGEGEVFWLPGDPGVTFTRGDAYVMSGGVLVAAGDSSAGPYFYPTRTVTCAAATVAFTKPADLDVAANPADETTLIPCTTDLIGGTPVRLANYVNYGDETVVSYDASSRAIACTTGFGADNRPAGAIVYVYEGPGAGECNVVESYDHADGAAELLLVCHRPFSATLTTSSKFVVLGSDTATNAIAFFGRTDLDATAGDVDCDDGADDGDLIACLSWQDVPEYVGIGQIPVIKASSLV